MSIRPDYNSSVPASQVRGESIQRIKEKLGLIPTNAGKIDGRTVDQATPVSNRRPVEYADRNPPKIEVPPRPPQKFTASPQQTPSRPIPTPLPEGFSPSRFGNIPIPERRGSVTAKSTPPPKYGDIPIPPRPAVRTATQSTSSRPTLMSKAEAEAARSTRLAAQTTKTTPTTDSVKQQITTVQAKLSEVKKLAVEAKLSERKLYDVEGDINLKKKFPFERSSLLADMKTAHNQKLEALKKGMDELTRLRDGLKETKGPDRSTQRNIDEMTKEVGKEIKDQFSVKLPKERSMKTSEFKTKLSELEASLRDTVTRSMSVESTEKDVKKELENLKKQTGKSETQLHQEIADARNNGRPIPYGRLDNMEKFLETQKQLQTNARAQFETRFSEFGHYKSSNKELNTLYKKLYNESEVILKSGNPLKRMDEWWDRNKSMGEIVSGFTKSNNETFGETVPFRKPIDTVGLWDNSLDLLIRRETNEGNKKSYQELKSSIHSLTNAFNAVSPELGGFYYKKDIEDNVVDFKPPTDAVWTMSQEKKTRTIQAMSQLKASLDQLEKDLSDPKKINFTKDSPGQTALAFTQQNVVKGKDRLDKLASQLGVRI